MARLSPEKGVDFTYFDGHSFENDSRSACGCLLAERAQFYGSVREELLRVAC